MFVSSTVCSHYALDQGLLWLLDYTFSISLCTICIMFCRKKHHWICYHHSGLRICIPCSYCTMNCWIMYVSTGMYVWVWVESSLQQTRLLYNRLRIVTLNFDNVTNPFLSCILCMNITYEAWPRQRQRKRLKCLMIMPRSYHFNLMRDTILRF